MKRQLKLGLAGLALAAASLFISPQAMAADYSGDCAHAFLFDGNGSAEFTDSSCSPGNVSATGHITFHVSSLTAGSLTAGADITIDSSGTTQTSSIISSNGSVTITGDGNIQTGLISSQYGIAVSTTTGTIHATGGISSPFGEVNLNTPDDDVTVTSILSGQNTIVSGANVTASSSITSKWGVKVDATDGDIDLDDVVSNSTNTSFGGNVLLTATGNIGVGNVTNQGTSTTGGIEIRAHTGGSGDPFNIGGGGSNGSGVLTTTNTTGGGSDPYFIVGGVYVTDPGGITIDAVSDIAINASASRSGILMLDAGDGTITLPAGNLNSDGAAGYPAGKIVLIAQTVTTVDGSILSASQDSSSSGTEHGVAIAAQTINVAGSTGFQVIGDGTGYEFQPGIVAIMPKGGAVATSTGDVNNLYWTVTYPDYFALNGSVTVTGSGAFKARANGTNNEVAVTGYPVSFENAAVTLQSTGSGTHGVYVGYNGTWTDTTGVSFTGTGAVVIDASGDDGDGGTVQIYADQATITSPSFTMKSNGDTSGTGNGGQVVFEPSAATIDSTFKLQANGGSTGGNGGNVLFYMKEASLAGDSFTVEANGSSGGNGDGGVVLVQTYPSAITLDSGTTALIQANASSSGTGNANENAVSFNPGETDFNVGSDEGQFAFAARGGSSGGNGGGITIGGYSSAVTVYGAGETTSPIDARAIGATGNGGKIYLVAYAGLTFDGDASVLTVESGTTSGDGGTIHIETSINPVVIGTGSSGMVTLTANSNGHGNGGEVSVLSSSGITADPTKIDVSAQDEGKGGKISLDAGYSSLELNGNLNADGGDDDGEGGTINLSAGGFTLPSGANTKLVADGNGDGKGGSIAIATHWAGIDVSGNDGSLNLEARNKDSGDGGSVSISSDSAITIDPVAINVGAGHGSGGTGGSITVSSPSDVTVSGEIDASGGCDYGSGGTVNVSGDNVTVGDINAKAGDGACMAFAKGRFVPRATGNGTGGTVSVVSTTKITLDGNIFVDASGSGTAGNITITGETTEDLTLTDRTLSASGADSSEANGGHILVTNLGNVIIANATLLAKGGPNGGNGGNITIGTPTDNTDYFVDISTAARIDASANSSGSGQGGLVTIPNSGDFGNPPDLLQYVYVDGGNSNPTTNDGGITLNGVTCNQLKTSYSPFPLTFWNCLSSTTGNEPLVATVADALPSGVKSAIDSMQDGRPQTQLFVFANGSAYQTFWRFSNPATPPVIDNNYAGNTMFKDHHVYVGVFENVILPGGLTTLDAAFLQEVGAHELGHAVDEIMDPHPTSGSYAQWLNNDLRYLDYVGGLQSTPRPACSSTNTAPFDGVKNYLTGAYICDPMTHSLDSAFTGFSNSKILKVTSFGIFDPTQVNISKESFAQAFAFQVFVSNATLNPSAELFHKTVDGVFGRIISPLYLGCLQYKASTVLGNSLTQPSYCGDTNPGWYTPFQ